MIALTPILELPPDVQLPESVASELNMRLLWIGQQLKQLASQSDQSSSAGGTGSAQASGAGMVIGTRSQRLTIAAYDANNFKGEQFLETDTTLVYISAPLSAGGKGYVWKYMSGTARGTFAARLTGLGSLDTGLLYYATDRSLTYRWDGAWALLINYEPIIADTPANWTLASYNPANYAPGQQFLATTWGVTYTVEAGVWKYSSGMYIAPLASLPGTAFNGAALGANDRGFLFHASDRSLTYQWSGAAWNILVTFEPAVAATLADWTNANYAPGNYYPGQQFFNATWLVTYISGAGVWLYASGTYVAPAASRPVTGFNGAALGPNDTGLQFLASDTGAFQIWNGAAWAPVSGTSESTTPFAPVLAFGGSSAGIAYGLQAGTSSVVGNLVTVVVNVNLTNKGTATGAATINIPLAAGITATGVGVYASMVGVTSMLGQVAAGNAHISLLNTTATTVTPLTDANFNNGSVLQMSLTYTT